MSRNNVNYSKTPKRTDLIPLGIFSVEPIQNENGSDIFLNLLPFTNKQVSSTDVGITYNHLLDKIFIFSHDEYLHEKSLYFNNNWLIGPTDNIYGIYYHFPVISVMTYPSTIYKLNRITFENNHTIRKVHDLYTFVFNDISGLFKNCINLIECDIERFGPSLILPDSKLCLDMLFANCNLLTIGQSATKKSKWMKYCNDNPEVKVSMNYALMNTPKLKNNTFFHSIMFNVDENGGKGIFLNSNINYEPLLNLSNVYELRNTFNGSTTSIEPFPYSVNITSAKLVDAMFKESSSFSNIVLYNGNDLSIMNGLLKDNIKVKTFSLESNTIYANEAIDLFSGCTELSAISTNIRLDNCEYTPNIFKNCNNLNTFYNIHIENSKIVSGMYEGCLKLDNVSKILDNGNNHIINLTNAHILNNMFKNCKMLEFDKIYVDQNNGNKEIEISLHTNGDIYTDGMFEGCETLTKQPILNDDGIISTACMYKDCTNLSDTSVCEFIMSKDSSAMYNGCTSLTNHNMSEFNSPIITTSMFENCSSLNGGNYNLSNTLYCANMFKNCTNISNISSINKSDYSLDVSSMFEGCSSLTSTPGIFNSRNARLLNSTFKGCYNLTNLDLCLDNAINMDGIFYGCNSLSTLNIKLNKSNLNRFPRINLRGTNISYTNFLEISTKVPDMSKYLYYNGGNNIIPELTWSLIEALDIFDYKENFVAWKSQTFTLVPGRYLFNVSNNEDIAVAIIKVTDNVHEPISPLIYTRGIYIDFTFDVSEEGRYYIYEYNDAYSGTMSINWIEPYYTIDIRNTPILNTDVDKLNNVITNLNSKGWHVITNDTLVIPEEGEEPISYALNRGNIDNYLEGLNITSIENINETEEFNLDAGYYTVFDENNIIDKIKIYKVLEEGSYPIAMSYNDDHIVNFEIKNECIIKIKYRNSSNGIKMKKM